MQSFIDFIKQHIFISEEIEAAIKSVAIEKEYLKNDLLVEEGKTCKYLYFLTEGTVRAYLYLKGKDITNWIYPENSMFTSWHSYILRKPSSEYIEVTNDAKVIAVSYDDWQELYQKYPKLERFGRLIMEEQIGLIDDFYKGYYFLTAKEKYELLIKAYPRIIQIANLGHIASMLGISQETLSRIRGK
ncbi:Crp/Fnr family transcriptional regulator [Tenacibaculum aiptasiae]|uniref:Crp/Fnr family transcriptional regulator n=1 Tax=Tenacibaculum aiptasiae TaxID=426481 RepID=UPI00232ABAFB|nr:Crp/Fnr family transcriptional regulator [Tenacibaculum aiptasiae]